MTKIGTLIWLILAMIAGFGLFHIKYQVQQLESELKEIYSQIDQNQTAIHVLNAEWHYLTEPTRLRKLSEKYLDASPLIPSQMIALQEFNSPAFIDNVNKIGPEEQNNKMLNQNVNRNLNSSKNFKNEKQNTKSSSFKQKKP
ncbi:MAG: hypothetical protein K1X44_04580 [Alphaproteobacteria bacterium]|nr:hypothetical protein [Alphaproteobacteria bacterium]